MIKSITDLLDVLSEINIDDTSGNDGEIVLDDDSVMTLGLTTSRYSNLLNIEKISVANARLNLEILVKRKPEKIILTLKKKDSNE